MITVGHWLAPSTVLDQMYELERLSPESENLTKREIQKRVDYAMSSFLRRLGGAAILTPNNEIVLVNHRFLRRLARSMPLHHWLFEVETGELGWTHNLSMLFIPPYGPLKYLLPGSVVLGMAVGIYIEIQNPTVDQNHAVREILVSSAGALLTGVITWLCLTAIIRFNTRGISKYFGCHLMIHPGSWSSFKSLYYSQNSGLTSVNEEEQGSTQSSEELDPIWKIERAGTTEEACARAIVNAFDNQQERGRRFVKHEATTQFRNIVESDRAFTRAWELARRMRPQLGQGGRPFKTETPDND